VVFQLIEVLAPQAAVRREPIIELGQWLGADAVEAALRVGTRLDQASVLQHPQVLGDGGLTEAQPIYELAHGSLAVPEDL
jgi:hypothetical protein